MHQRPKRREDGFGFHSVNLVLLSIQSEKLLLYDTLQERLLERIQRLEDDRHSVGLTSGQCGGVLLTPMLTAQHAFARLRQPALFLLAVNALAVGILSSGAQGGSVGWRRCSPFPRTTCLRGWTGRA